MASGVHVIAFGEGGACETVNNKVGILFKHQTVDSLCEAIMQLESGRIQFNENDIRARAQYFTEERFKTELQNLIPDYMAE